MDVSETFHLVFGPDSSSMAWWQMCIRALLIFVYGIALFILSRRSFRRRTPLDVIIAVILGSALSRAITGGAHLLPTMAATATLVLAHNAVAWLACHFSFVDKFVKQEDPIPLMRQGRVERDGMLKALVTERDLSRRCGSAGCTASTRSTRRSSSRAGRSASSPAASEKALGTLSDCHSPEDELQLQSQAFFPGVASRGPP